MVCAVQAQLALALLVERLQQQLAGRHALLRLHRRAARGRPQVRVLLSSTMAVIGERDTSLRLRPWGLPAM
jgi:hypothetical protein